MSILDTRDMENDPIYTYTDASDLAAAAIYENSWVILQFDGDNEWMKAKTIAWHELLSIVMCLAVFGNRMENRCRKMYTDNQAILYAINTGTCKDDSIMALIHSLYWYTTLHNIIYKAYYISSLDNAQSDSLSRLDFNR